MTGPGMLGSWRLVGIMFDDQHLVDWHVSQHVDVAVRPGDFNGVDNRVVAEPECERLLGHRQVAVARPHTLQLRPRLRNDPDARTDCILISARTDERQSQECRIVVAC